MDSRRKIITTNALFLFISQVVARLATFIASIFLIRYLGVVGYGQYSTVIAYVGLFSVISDLGLGQLIIREVAGDKRKAGIYLGNFIVLQFFIGSLILILLSLFIRFFNYSPLINLAVFIYGISLFFNSLTIPFQSLISAFEKMHFNALANIISSFITAILIIWLIFNKANLLGILTVYSFASIVNLIISVWFCNKKIPKPIFKIDLKLWKKLLKLALPFVLVSFLSVIYNKIDILMLSKMKDETVVGIYNAAYRFIDIWWIIQIAINNAFFPHLSRQFKENITMLKRNLKRLFWFQGIIGGVIAIVITLSAGMIIKVFVGRQFLTSIPLLKILIWYVPLQFMAGSLANILMAIGKTEKFAIASGINVLIVVLLNLLLIPQYGFYATSLTTLLSGIVLLLICGFFVWTEKLL